LESDHRNPEKTARKNTEPERERGKKVLQAQSSEEKNGDIQLGYLGRAALRREQCDEVPEIGIEE
jgi:hypothetical protein